MDCMHHGKSLRYKQPYTEGDLPIGFTCHFCFTRLVFGLGLDDYVPDPTPAVWCLHLGKKNPIKTRLDEYPDHRLAFCNDCGCMIHHPPGPGSWDEVMFYGYVIEEEE